MAPSLRLLTVTEACQYLSVSRMTLLAAEEAGLLSPARTPGGHRRYDPGELDRFLNRGRGPGAVVAPADESPRSTSEGSPPLGGASALLLRGAARRLTPLLRAGAAGIYLLDEAYELRWCASFGIPRWRVDQLSAGTPPAAVIRGLMRRRVELFEPAREQFPLPTSRGCGAAVPLLSGDEPLGMLVATSHRDRLFLASEVEIIETCAFYVGQLVVQQRRLDELECRIAQVQQIVTTPEAAPDASD